jgi:VanZ family protein
VNRTLARSAFYTAPLAVWLALIYSLSTSAGASGVSVSLIERALVRFVPAFHQSLTAYQMDWINYLARKCAHFTEYFVLLLLAVRALQYGDPRIRWGRFAGAVALSLAWALADEFHQSFVPGRTAYLDDVYLDWSGCAAAAIVTLARFGERSLEHRLNAGSKRARPGR